MNPSVSSKQLEGKTLHCYIQECLSVQVGVVVAASGVIVDAPGVVGNVKAGALGNASAVYTIVLTIATSKSSAVPNVIFNTLAKRALVITSEWTAEDVMARHASFDCDA